MKVKVLVLGLAVYVSGAVLVIIGGAATIRYWQYLPSFESKSFVWMGPVPLAFGAGVLLAGAYRLIEALND